MLNNGIFDYVTANVTLYKNTVLGNIDLDIPDGRVVALGNVIAGDAEGRIIDMGIFKNNNAVVQPADYRFSEKTNGGTFQDSMRPVDFEGGSRFQVRLTSSDASAANDITIQVIFMIYKGDR